MEAQETADRRVYNLFRLGMKRMDGQPKYIYSHGRYISDKYEVFRIAFLK